MFRISRWLNGKDSACSAGDYGDSSSSLGGEDALEEEMATRSSTCLENTIDRGAWLAAILGVSRSRTWSKRLSTSPEIFCPAKSRVLSPRASHPAVLDPAGHEERFGLYPLCPLTLTPWLTPWLAFIWGSHKLPLTDQPQGELKHFGHLWKLPPEDCEHPSYTLALQRIRDDFLT